MTAEEQKAGSVRKPGREFPFIPRTINPVKISNVVILSAGEGLRDAGKILHEQMPWVRTQVLSDPADVSTLASTPASVLLLDDTAMIIADTEKVRQMNNDLVLVLLSSNPLIYCSSPSVAQQRFAYTRKADLVFAMDDRECPPHELVASVVRSAEDLLNIRKYSKARRFIFLVVDDEPRWFSQFLPVLYDIIGQRADVMITRTYEDTLSFLFGAEDETEIDEDSFRSWGSGDDVVCLITDIFFPRGSEQDSDAGIDLIKLTRKYYPRYPVVIASKAKEAKKFEDMAFVLPKGDPGSLEKLRDYIQNFSGMGDFVLRDADGKELYRARNVYEIHDLLLAAEKETAEAGRLRASMERYAENDFFSTWLYMHSYRELADVLRPKKSKGKQLISLLKRYLRREILRMNCTPLVIDGHKVYTLGDLLCAARTVSPDKMQPLSDSDIFSSWLDRKGYPELAEELRPIHESGERMRHTLIRVVEKWMAIYEKRTEGMETRKQKDSP